MGAGDGGFRSASGFAFLFVLLGWVVRCHFARSGGGKSGGMATVRCSSLEVEVVRAQDRVSYEVVPA